MTLRRHLCSLVLMCLSFTAFAEEPEDPNSRLLEYLQNFGSYIGYDITNPPEILPPVNLLFNPTREQTLLSALITTFFKSQPVAAAQSDFSTFVPANADAMNINQLANGTFASYNSPNSGGAGATISANPLLDQQAYQLDPVSQAVLNIIATPTSTNDPACESCVGEDCTPLCRNSIMNNVVGTIPTPDLFFQTAFNEKVVSQLNANVLVAPLLYSTTSATSSSQNQSKNSSEEGLQAKSQVELAANFIQYATGNVFPLGLPTYADYSALYTATLETDQAGNATATAVQQRAAIAGYFSQLRVYAAQSSVAISNLYSILSRRLPQNTASDSAATSEALAEFNMATWRINTPPAGPDQKNTQWIDQINQATPASVQKEMAILLAEINYQLYLSRQQQERILLTNSLMLLQARHEIDSKIPVITATSTESDITN